ncbi:hypothetical protein H0H92_015957, partial [Tricholoma furcatifolium]
NYVADHLESSAHRTRKKRDRAKDVYDLGLMLKYSLGFRKTFHLLTGEAFLPQNINKVEDLLMEGKNVATTDIPSTATFIKKCLKDLDEIPDAEDLLNDLWLEDGVLFD